MSFFCNVSNIFKNEEPPLKVVGSEEFETPQKRVALWRIQIWSNPISGSDVTGEWLNNESRIGTLEVLIRPWRSYPMTHTIPTYQIWWCAMIHTRNHIWSWRNHESSGCKIRTWLTTWQYHDVRMKIREVFFSVRYDVLCNHKNARR